MTRGTHMEIQWTKAEREHLEAMAEAQAAPATLALEGVFLFLARASGQVKEDATAVRQHMLSHSDDCSIRTDAQGAECDCPGGDAADALSRLSALSQGSESAYQRGRDDERASASAEMERLKAILHRKHVDLEASESEAERLKARSDGAQDRVRLLLDAKNHWANRARAAESRLAAIWERGGRDMPLVFPANHAEVRKHIAWVLEGDATNPSTTSNGSDDDAPQEAQAPIQLPVPPELHSGLDAALKAKGAPVEMVLACTACGKTTPHVWMRRGHEAASRWRCDACGLTSSAGRYPCSTGCTHDDAATPGHLERVRDMSAVFRRSMSVSAELARERREAMWAVVAPAAPADSPIVDEAAARDEPLPDWAVRLSRKSHDEGAEAMQFACYEALGVEMHRLGLAPDVQARLKAAIEGAAP